MLQKLRALASPPVPAAPPTVAQILGAVLLAEYQRLTAEQQTLFRVVLEHTGDPDAPIFRPPSWQGFRQPLAESPDGTPFQERLAGFFQVVATDVIDTAKAYGKKLTDARAVLKMVPMDTQFTAVVAALRPLAQVPFAVQPDGTVVEVAPPPARTVAAGE